MDTLEALALAQLVLREGSFSAAAQRRGASPAVVAKQVAQLEQRLNLRLFERSTRHLAPTPEGRALLHDVAPPLRELQQRLAGGRQRGAAGVVKVSVSGAFARLALVPTLPAFQQRHPDVQLDLHLENRRVDLLAEGYDCAIGTALPEDAALVSRQLVTLRSVLCASPAYLAEHGVPTSLADLARHRLVAMRSETTGRVRPWRLLQRGGASEFEPAAALVLSDPEGLAAAAEAGCGIALVGQHFVADALAQGRLQRVLPERAGPRFNVVVYFAQRRLLPARTRAFVDHVVAAVPQVPAMRAMAATLAAEAISAGA
jgi:DNA-binding transcriptional LysR family regulator